MQVHKYYVQDLLPHGHELLEQFGLKGCGTSAATCLETMEDVVEFNGGGEAEIENDC